MENSIMYVFVGLTILVLLIVLPVRSGIAYDNYKLRREKR